MAITVRDLIGAILGADMESEVFVSTPDGDIGLAEFAPQGSSDENFPGKVFLVLEEPAEDTSK